jgi:hypothetical protein
LSIAEFYHNVTFNLTELLDYFYVETLSNKDGTNFDVFWYETIKRNQSGGTANNRKAFLDLDFNDWTTKV